MIADVPTVAALLAAVAWVVMLLFRGGFWRADRRLSGSEPAPAVWPEVVAVIPARNEAATIGRTVGSLMSQDYPGRFHVIVVDDDSDDGTAVEALRAARESDRLTVVRGAPLETSWTGKLWAMEQGVRRAEKIAPGAVYLLFTDADIVHDPASLRRLVVKAEAGRLALVSLMVRLVSDSGWERLLIPAFVFFFQKLYPFPWVNDPAKTAAAAAGGCVLLRRDVLTRAGGLQAIRDRIIDDCALAALVKGRGRAAIWLGLDDRVRSLRGYESLAGIWAMVTRTAYEQLGNSFPMLIGAVAGMVLIYLVPPVTAVVGLIAGNGVLSAVGAVGWGLMALSYRPTLRLYGQPAWRAFLLPGAAFLYTAMMVDSARRTWLGRGGAWKGRHYRGAGGGLGLGPG